MSATATKWSLRGTLLIACNCDYFGCPCNIHAQPSNGNCEGGWLWHVEDGAVGDVSLDELSFSVYANWPGAIHEGGGRAVSLYDERADERQVEAITALIRGELDGPWSILIDTYELEVIRPEPFNLELDGIHSTAIVGDAITLRMTTLKDPVTGDEVHPGVVLPEGLVCKEASIGMSEAFWVSGELEYDHSGQYVAAAPFDYAGP